MLPFFLLVAGWWLEWGPGTRPGSGWGITLLGLAITYVGIVGAAQVLGVSGGRLGRALAGTLTDLFTAPGAFILLDRAGGRRHHRRLRDPAPAADEAGGRHGALDGRDRGGLAQADAGRGGRGRDGKAAAAAAATTATNGRKDKPVPVGPGKSPGQTGAWDDDDGHPGRGAEPAPNSATFAPPAGRPAPSRRLRCSPVRVRDPSTT